MRSCVECGEPNIPSHTRKTVCSSTCQNRRRERQRATAVCGICQTRLSYKSSTAAPFCLECRSATRLATVRGKSVTSWRCAACDGECEREPTKGQRPKWCADCRKPARAWIAKSARTRIYLRDEWMCWLCNEEVDADLIGSRSEWRPSLDHVIPVALGGDDGEDNLRLAHVWCNSVRSDGRVYDAQFLRPNLAS